LFQNLRELSELGSAGRGLIVTSSWLGWPKQPIKGDVLCLLLSGSIFKWGAGSGKGILLLRNQLTIGWWEHCIYIFFLLIFMVVIFSTLCGSAKLFSSQPTSFVFSFWFCSPSHQGGGRSERATVWFCFASWG